MKNKKWLITAAIFMFFSCQKIDETAGTKNTDEEIATSINKQPNSPQQHSVKIYRALISQLSNNPPTAIVLENSLGTNPVWEYQSVGYYTLTLYGAFPEDKTFLVISNNGNINTSYVFYSNNDNQLGLETGLNGVNVDHILTNTSIEVIVYP